MNLAADRYTYDQLHYVGKSYAQTHPDRLAALGWLHGLRPAPATKCRVLELACGDGANLIPLACALPGSTFEGIDLAATPLAAGQRRAEALGLGNLRMRAGNLLDFPPDAGEFDYIIAHGFYSWCPPAVRDKILAVCGAHLAPQGMAFVSFNAYPGYHAKDLQRRLMLYHLSHTRAESPEEQAREAIGALEFVASSQPPDNPHQTLLRGGQAEYWREIKTKGAAGLAWFHHDLLSVHNQPVYFQDFVAHAAGHGLRYVADTFMRVPRVMDLPEDTKKVLAAMTDVLTREQYLDFILNVTFRQAVLCRAEVTLDHDLTPASMGGLQIAGNLVPLGDGPEGATFQAPRGKLTVKHEDAKAVLRQIAAAWPGAVSFEELLARQPGSGTPVELTEFLLRLYVGKFASFRREPHQSALVVSERPEGSAVAREQARRGVLITNLYHEGVSLEPAARHLLGLLDGRRGRTELLAEMRAWIASGAAAEAHRLAASDRSTEDAVEEGRPAVEPPSLETLEDDLDAGLQAMVKLGLVVG